MTLLPLLFFTAWTAFASTDPSILPSTVQQATDSLAPAPLEALPQPKRFADDRDEPRFVPSAFVALGGVVLAGSAIWYFANQDRIDPSIRKSGANPFAFKVGAALAIPLGGLITVVGIGDALESLRPEP